MGGNSSKSSVQQTNEFFNKQTNSFMSSVSQNVSATAGARQSVNLADTNFTGCRVNVSQGAQTTLTASGTLKSQNVQDLKTKLQNDAKTAIDNAAAQKSGFLAPSVANSASATTDLKNKVTNIIENTMSSSTVQNIVANAQNNQSINAGKMVATCDPKYRLPGEYDFNFDQNILQSVTAKGIADALTNALSDTIATATTDTAVKQTAKQETQGVNDLVDSVFKGMTGIWAIIAVICCVIICGALIFLMSPAGQDATRTAANAGAGMAKARMGKF
jgi:hypothetical protein